MKSKILFLGTGTSSGVPEIGCDCEVCTSRNPKNKRLRTSVYIEFTEGELKKYILIDTSPDFRYQALKYNIRWIDAILYTHSHYDHIGGFDEIRRFNILQKRAIPVYGTKSVIKNIKHNHKYVFKPIQIGGGVPQIKLNKVIPYKEFNIGFVKIIPLLVYHGKLKIVGYRFKDFAYITDASFLPAKTMEYLKNLKLLILNALRYREHETHFNLEQALRITEKINPEKALYVHMTHDLEHERVNKKELPAEYQLAFDGQIVVIGDGAQLY